MSNDPRSLVFDEVLLSMEARFDFEASKYGSFDANISKNKRFASLVGTGKEFDYKNKVGSIWDESSDQGGRMSIWNNRLMRSDDWGNYAFGVAAKAYGFSKGWAIFGAGMAQVLDGVKLGYINSGDLRGFPTLERTSKFHNIHWSNFGGFFDGTRDTQLIKAGFQF
jgi:hypothetical protein